MDPVEYFTQLIPHRGPEPDLDVAALAIAAGAEPGLDPRVWLRELDRLAEGVDSLDKLVHRLFAEEGFAGNSGHYFDPRNSLLNHVLSRRLGIPITLSVVAMEVGRRAGVPLEGVGMPGHFLVRPPGGERYLDAFAGGELLDEAGCEARFRASTGAGPDVAFGPHLLSPAPPRAILARMLENLRGIYRAQHQPAGLEWVLRMRIVLPGVGTDHLTELANAMGEQGRWLDGAAFLESRRPHWPEQAGTLDRGARSLRAQLN